MINLVIKIDCGKTEKCFNALCITTGKTHEDMIKSLFNLNEDLIGIVNNLTPNHMKEIKDMFGEEIANDLFGIL